MLANSLGNMELKALDVFLCVQMFVRNQRSGTNVCVSGMVCREDSSRIMIDEDDAEIMMGLLDTAFYRASIDDYVL